MEILQFGLLRQAKVESLPFEHLILPGLVRAKYLDALQREFPVISEGGSFHLSSLRYGPVFRQLTDELLSLGMRMILAERFQMDLEKRPATLTVRGRTREKDGKIHIDSKTKLLAVMLYMNRDWYAPGGRLRLLRSSHDMDDMIAEVPPEEGTLVAFRCRPNAWHGHRSFVGERRSLQLNYVVSSTAGRWSSVRHRLSALSKSLRR
jgi:SM-20-related protein